MYASVSVLRCRGVVGAGIDFSTGTRWSWAVGLTVGAGHSTYRVIRSRLDDSSR